MRFDPTLNGNGGGGTATAARTPAPCCATTGHDVLIGSDPVTQTNAPNRDYACRCTRRWTPTGRSARSPTATPARRPTASTQLDASHRLTAVHDATDTPGNLVQTAEVDLGRDGAFSLDLGFGTSAADAASTARSSLRSRPVQDAARYAAGWLRYDAGLRRPDRPRGVSPSAWRESWTSTTCRANYVKTAEDKTFPGAVAAAMASPWGQAVSAGDPSQTYFGSYREVFARDLYEAWTALYLAGDRDTARDMTRFLFERQQLPDGSMPRNSLTNGKVAPDSFGTQLDECAYPIVMALAVGLTGAATTTATTSSPRRTSSSPTARPTATSAGRSRAATRPRRSRPRSPGWSRPRRSPTSNGDVARRAVWRGVADEFQRNLKGWTLTTNGPLRRAPYFIRLSKTGDPNAAISYNVGNGGPTLDQRDVIDAGFLEYVRLGLLPGRRSGRRAVAAGRRRRDPGRAPPSGDGFYRYNGDGYGDRSVRRPPVAAEQPGQWPSLAGAVGRARAVGAARGDVAGALGLLKAMMSMARGVGLIPEQAWELPDLPASPFGTDPTQASIGFQNGKPAGSAAR